MAELMFASSGLRMALVRRSPPPATRALANHQRLSPLQLISLLFVAQSSRMHARGCRVVSCASRASARLLRQATVLREEDQRKAGSKRRCDGWRDHAPSAGWRARVWGAGRR
jgi:hypothetical protein